VAFKISVTVQNGGILKRTFVMKKVQRCW